LGKAIEVHELTENSSNNDLHGLKQFMDLVGLVGKIIPKHSFVLKKIM